MAKNLFRSNKNHDPIDKPRARFRLRGKSLTMIMALVALSGLFIAACSDDATKKPSERPTVNPKVQQVLVWDTTPAAKITEGEITPFLAKAVLTKNLGLAPTCKPSYSLAKAGAADATIDLKGKILEGVKPGVVTLTASCAADTVNGYTASSIDAKVEIVAKPRGNFQFGLYMDATQANWQDTTAQAANNEMKVTQPSYSMYSYLETVLSNNPALRTIPDATFLILNEKPGAYAIGFSLQKDSTSYLLSLNYKPSATETKYLAVRVTLPEIGDVANKNYQIKNADDLLKIRWNLKGNYTLSKSFAIPNLEAVNFLAIPDYEKKGWSPIADAAKPFQGTLDGNNFTIMNIVIPDSFDDHASLLGVLKSATVKNLKMQEADIYGGNYVGMLAGKAENVTLENLVGKTRPVSAKGVGLVSGARYVGGLVGELVNTDQTKTLKNLSFDGVVFGVTTLTKNTELNKNIGGIIGSLTGKLDGADFNGRIFGYDNAGGIVGELKGTLNLVQVPSNTRVEGSNRVGGIVGSLESGEVHQAAFFGRVIGFFKTADSTNTGLGGIAGYAKGSISRSYAKASIEKANSEAGGIVGLYAGTASNSITDSYATPTFVDSPFTKTGGLVGSVDTAGALTLKNSFVTVWPKTRATAIVGSSTAAPSLEAVYFPISVQGSGELQGSSAMAANSATYDASFAGYKTSGFWQLGDKANWPVLINLPAELEPIAIQ